MHSGGSHYGAPLEMTFVSGAHGGITMAEEASPISSCPPPAGRNYAQARLEGFTDEESLAAAGEEGERGLAAGNRWPRQETLALLKIRSDMDAAFRDATLKGPLWEEVSRQLMEMGYQRSAKKCKEKFENVHKYYKRTKDGRAGRQDGKTYRFFSQLEALQNPAANSATAVPAAAVYPLSNSMVDSSSRMPPPPLSPLNSTPPPAIGTSMGFSFSSDAFSSSSSESEEEYDAEENIPVDPHKRKKRSGGQKMMAFFEGLMKQVIERQEMMQQRFLETIERREQERMMREEAWRRQEMAKAQREKEIIAQERALATSRDASIVAFLQKMTGHVPAPQPSPPPPLPPSQEVMMAVPPPDLDGAGEVNSTDPSSSRWPKAEVHALINLRIGLESKYQEAGPKGPLWEDVAAGMKRIGYNRTPKRCKEKWENINKYYKKVKESNKKRPEDSKTCPYFYQLDALYRKKLGQPGSAAAPGEETGGAALSNGEPSPSFFQENGDARSLNKAEEIVTTMETYEKLQDFERGVDRVNVEDDGGVDHGRKMAYADQYQERLRVNGTSDCGTTSSFMAMVQ